MQPIFPSPLNDILHTLWSNKMDFEIGKCYTLNTLKPSRVCFMVNISIMRWLYKINGMLTLHIPSLKPLHPLAIIIIVVCHNHSISLIKWTTATFFSKCHSLPDGYFPPPMATPTVMILVTVRNRISLFCKPKMNASPEWVNTLPYQRIHQENGHSLLRLSNFFV